MQQPSGNRDLANSTAVTCDGAVWESNTTSETREPSRRRLFCLICSVVSSEHPAGALRRGSLPFGWKVTGKFRIDVIGHSFRSLEARLAPCRVAAGEPYVTEREAIHSARSAGRRRRPTSARPNTLGNAFHDAVGCPRRVWSGHAERSTVHDGAKQHGQPMPAAGRSTRAEGNNNSIRKCVILAK